MTFAPVTQFNIGSSPFSSDLAGAFSAIIYNFKLREGLCEALFNIRGALDTVMDGAHGAVSVFSLDGVIDQDSEQFQAIFLLFLATGQCEIVSHYHIRILICKSTQ